MPPGLDLITQLRQRADSTAIVSDFDGTLSAIVDDPAKAAPLAGVADVLDQLVAGYRLVGIISGRPLSFLESLHLPAGVALVGLYGLEQQVDGRRREHPEGEQCRVVISQVVAEARRDGPAGMRVEDKGLSLTLHYRGRPEIAPAVRSWADAEGERHQLVVRPARMSVELHPPIDMDKGRSLAELIGEVRGACYLGDDHGDVPAFDALDRFASDGGLAVRVAVAGGSESVPELGARADLSVDGPPGALGFLRSLVV